MVMKRTKMQSILRVKYPCLNLPLIAIVEQFLKNPSIQSSEYCYYLVNKDFGVVVSFLISNCLEIFIHFNMS